jgi:hypothetical protein
MFAVHSSAVNYSRDADLTLRHNDREDLTVSHGQAHENDLDVLIQTGITDPIAIGLAENLLQDAGIPFFEMDRNVVARQESGNFLNWWNVRVSSDREAEAREIIRCVEETK